MSLYLGGHITGTTQSHPQIRELGATITQTNKNAPHPDS
jgi:hypothetical protein